MNICNILNEECEFLICWMNVKYSCAKYLNIDNFNMYDIENDCTISIFEIESGFSLCTLKSG